MRALLIIVLVAVIVVIGAFAFGLVDINQTRSGRLPDVAVQGGQAPAFDVKTGDVAVGTTTRSVEVPKVSVGTGTEEVKLPTVEVKKAE
jgi:hypothetical protein